VTLLKYRPEVAPWHFRSHRLRRLHRKLAHIDGASLRRRHQHHRRREYAGPEAASRRFRAAHRGTAARPIVRTMQRVWAINELVQFQRSEVPLFPSPRRAQRPARRRRNS
jgi:hypothetical protein